MKVNKKKCKSGEIELLFSVTDTGIGINTSNLEIIFNKFTQISDNSYTRHQGGTGLGLAITKSLVELMNGELWVESTEDMGSIFYFTTKVKIETSRDCFC